MIFYMDLNKIRYILEINSTVWICFKSTKLGKYISLKTSFSFASDLMWLWDKSWAYSKIIVINIVKYINSDQICVLSQV